VRPDDASKPDSDDGHQARKNQEEKECAVFNAANAISEFPKCKSSGRRDFVLQSCSRSSEAACVGPVVGRGDTTHQQQQRASRAPVPASAHANSGATPEYEARINATVSAGENGRKQARIGGGRLSHRAAREWIVNSRKLSQRGSELNRRFHAMRLPSFRFLAVRRGRRAGHQRVREDRDPRVLEISPANNMSRHPKTLEPETARWSA